MTFSLDKLAFYLKTDEKTTVAKEFFKVENTQLFMKEGVFLYEYLDNRKKLQDQCLPNKEDFHNVLTNSDISDADYEWVQFDEIF